MAQVSGTEGMGHVLETGEFDPQGDVIRRQIQGGGECDLGVLSPVQKLFFALHFLAEIQLNLQLMLIAQTQTCPRIHSFGVDCKVHQEEIDAPHEILQFEIIITQKVINRLDSVRKIYRFRYLVRFT